MGQEDDSSCNNRPKKFPFNLRPYRGCNQSSREELRYPKSNISLRPSGGVAQGEAVTVWCVCQCLGVRFLLRKGGAMAAHRTTAPAVDVVEFPICNVRRGDAGSYCCRYRTKWDPLISSEPSDPMELAVPQGEPTQLSWEQCRLPPAQAVQGQVHGLGAGNHNQHPPETGESEPSPAPGLTCPIIAGTSAAATGLLFLLLLLAFLCYRRNPGGKGPAPRQSRCPNR
ncbi:leukocyte immunoglobulin-like receptor subfamily B member 2 isoform X1 [Gopherus evgoodei]|uniref:leukocyte immunoglobulin-like receptor subfamily B member 2 isoform X1 n=1 Tax=Gopherus evgoodei TaxID=1825980 RepID=UPI0011CFFA4A|nr:leukocyte immunoglobulin-like receptor subfamily B member 2 isoform X1 [Gopherus evgoodei]